MKGGLLGNNSNKGFNSKLYLASHFDINEDFCAAIPINQYVEFRRLVTNNAARLLSTIQPGLINCQSSETNIIKSCHVSANERQLNERQLTQINFTNYQADVEYKATSEKSISENSSSEYHKEEYCSTSLNSKSSKYQPFHNHNYTEQNFQPPSMNLMVYLNIIKERNNKEIRDCSRFNNILTNNNKNKGKLDYSSILSNANIYKLGNRNNTCIKCQVTNHFMSSRCRECFLLRKIGSFRILN